MSDIKPRSASSEVREVLDEIETMTSEPKKTPKKGKSKVGSVILTLVLIVILVLAILYVISKTTNWDILGVSPDNSTVTVETPATASDWQAVFLSNGQVYFGKLGNVNSNYPVLEDIYYLQVQEVPIQPAEAAGGEEAVQPAQQTEQRMILVKFGTELHRPMDKMYLNRDHILFYEDLRSDSNVVQSIESYKAGEQQ